MAYKDNLTLYEEMIAIGVPKEQASLQAHQLGSLGGEVVSTCNEIKEQIIELKSDMKLSNSELKADMKWMKGIGYLMIVVFIANFVKLWLGH